MKALRALSLIWLVLVFATGSMTMAVARNQPRAVGAIELCTGNGLVSVSIDAQGNPTGPLMPCPDATQALAALTDVTVAVVHVQGTLTPVQFLTRNVPAPVIRTPLSHHSRAPPVAV